MGKKFITHRILPFLFALAVLSELISPSSSVAKISPPVSTVTQAVTAPETTTGLSKLIQAAIPSTTSVLTPLATIAAPVTTTAAKTNPSTTTSATTTPPVVNPPVATSPVTTTPPVATSPAAPIVLGDIASKSTGEIKIHFINVGQGDSIFIELPNEQTMLIDAGPSSAGTGVVNYIQGKTSALTYVVATHPHADHIGGMTKVINSLAIDRFIMPRKAHTTQTFEGMLDALSSNNIRVTEAKAGVSILDTKDLDIDILGPGISATGSNLNNYSAIIRIRYKEADFLFIGDAETSALSGLSSMNMDVLKVGHHGSTVSSPISFLKKVDPEHSVISVGSNSYGHPTKSALYNLYSVGSKVYRTDLSGTIIISSDGETITINKSPAKAVAVAPVQASPTTQPETTKPPATISTTTKDRIVYGTKTGAKYHESGCRYLSKSKIPMTLSKAKSIGLTPCSVCH